MSSIRARLLRLLKRNAFLSNVAKLLTGSALAQVVLAILVVFAARLYEPTDFAVLAVFIAIANLCAVLGCGRYEFAILVPAEDDDAFQVVATAVLLSAVTALLMLCVALIFHYSTAPWLHVAGQSSFLWYVPLGALLLGWRAVGEKWSTRTKDFNRIAAGTIVNSVAAGLVPLIGYYLLPDWRPSMLVVGVICGYALSSAILLAPVVRYRRWRLQAFNLAVALRIARTYWRFPAFAVPSGFVSQLAHKLPVLMLTGLGPHVLGCYALCNRVLSVPMVLISQTVGFVFLNRYCELRKEEDRQRSLTIKLYVCMSLLFLPVAAVIFLWGEALFALLFTDKWAQAGAFVPLMLPLLMAQFVVAPAALSMMVRERQLTVLGWSSLLLAVSFVVLHLGVLSQDASATIRNYCLSFAGVYGILIYITLRSDSDSRDDAS